MPILPIPSPLAIRAKEAAKINLQREIGFPALKKLLAFHNAALRRPEVALPPIIAAAEKAKDMRVRNAAALLLHAMGRRAIDGNSGEEITRRLIQMLPKVELHCHLDGSVSEEAVLYHARRQGIVLADDAGVKKYIPDFPRNPTLQDLRQYMRPKAKFSDAKFLEFLLAGFALPLAVMQDKIALEQIAYGAIMQAHEDGVLHIELRFAPCLHTEQGLTYDEAGEAIMQGLLRGEKEFGVSSTLVYCVYRDKVDQKLFGDKYVGHPVPTAESAVRLSRKYPKRIALDLVGYETPYPPQDYLEAFQLTFGTGVWRTVHAGESPGTGRNILTAVRKLRAHRIGHGIQIYDLSEEEREELKRSGIVFEVNVHSNFHLGLLGEEGLSAHPLMRMHRDGFRVVLGTDNRTVSDITLSAQIEEIADRLGLPLFTAGKVSDDLRAILSNAAAAAFAPRQRINALSRSTEEYFLVVEYLLKILNPSLSSG